MMIIDDSDVVFEGHALHHHLIGQGLTDFEVVNTRRIHRSKTSKQIFGQFFSNCKDIFYSFAFENKSYKEELHLSLMMDVEKILKSDLLLEEDSRCVRDATCLQKLVLPRPLCKSRIMVYMLDMIGTCMSMVAWKHGHAHWSLAILCSVLTTEHILFDWSVTQERSMLSTELEKVLLTCRNLYKTMRKTLNYVQENETIYRGHTLVRSARTDLDITTDVHHSNWFLMTGLRESICVAAEEAIHILQLATTNLMEEFPLKGQYNHKSNYCASTPLENYGVLNLSDENKQSLKYLKKLQLVYLYFQSEFLKRIAFTLIVELWKNKNQPLRPLFTAMKEISSKFSNLVDSMKLDFRYHYSYGLDKQGEERKPVPAKQKHWDVLLGVHSARLHLQGLLHRLWNSENSLKEQENENDPEYRKYIVSELNDIISHFALGRNCVEISVSQLVALSTPVTVEEQWNPASPPRKECDSSEPPVKPIPVGYTDLDPQVLDEVFEASTQDMDTKNDELDYELESMCLSNEELMKLQIEKECSSRVMTELKNVLIHKAEEMKHREARAVQRNASTNREILESDEDSGENSTLIDSDTLKSNTMDSMKSDDFSITSGIETTPENDLNTSDWETCQENSARTEESFKPTMAPSWPVNGIPTMLQARALVGDEEIFSDSGESIGDNDSVLEENTV